MAAVAVSGTTTTHGSSPSLASLASSSPGADWHTISVEVPFASPKHAQIAKQVIEVDSELQPQAVKRILVVQDDKLVATFHTLTIRLARLTVNAFLENVDLVVRTIEKFGVVDADDASVPS